jgi:exopolysaccharide/PEP-CTERM locus tyrosine autokinase
MIMVTSAVPGEGKSFISSNLAISIAQNIDEHVLLMDCDLRLPSIHNRFRFESKTGLSDYLTGNVPLSSLLVKVGIDKLSILPGGKPPANPSELLSSDKMTQLLEEVRARYEDRYIIIDSAPPQLTAESSALARQVDGIVLVINYGKTKRELVADLLEIIGKEKIIGVVFNRFNLRSSTYYGYGKYSHYGKYYGLK